MYQRRGALISPPLLLAFTKKVLTQVKVNGIPLVKPDTKDLPDTRAKRENTRER